MRRRIADALAEIDARLDQNQLLSAEAREEIKKKAREHVAQKRRDKAEADYLAEAIRLEEVSYNPLEQLEDVTVNLAPYVASQRLQAACMLLDGTQYFHGLTYSVTYSVARTMEDIMARSWEHEREIHGERRKADINRQPVSTYDPAKARIIGGNSSGATERSVVNTRSSLRDDTQI